ncbi:MAG: Heptaprenyl diphosphate synthase component 2 [Clostridium sp.]|jgi:heptaprenyl diphosphate synthase
MINQKSTELIGIEEAAERVKCEMNSALVGSPPAVREYMRHLARSRGKFIRALTVLSCSDNGEGYVPPDAIRFAVAVEILHLATLVHDDVIDDADLRRGDVTLQKKYGKHTAVVCGDYLFCLALRQASLVQNRQEYLDFEFPDYMSRVCLGELYETQNHFNLDLTISRYLRIIDGKTAALFEASCFAGAIVSHQSSRETKKYKRFGRYIGLIFQLTDDCIDFEVPEKLAKKPVQSDFSQGVVTLPLIYTFFKDTSCKEKAKEHRLTQSEMDSAVRRAGGLEFTHSIAKRYYDKALKILQSLSTTQAKKDRLKDILDRAFYGLKKKPQ